MEFETFGEYVERKKRELEAEIQVLRTKGDLLTWGDHKMLSSMESDVECYEYLLGAHAAYLRERKGRCP